MARPGHCPASFPSYLDSLLHCSPVSEQHHGLRGRSGSVGLAFGVGGLLNRDYAARLFLGCHLKPQRTPRRSRLSRGERGRNGVPLNPTDAQRPPAGASMVPVGSEPPLCLSLHTYQAFFLDDTRREKVRTPAGLSPQSPSLTAPYGQLLPASLCLRFFSRSSHFSSRLRFASARPCGARASRGGLPSPRRWRPPRSPPTRRALPRPSAGPRCRPGRTCHR